MIEGLGYQFLNYEELTGNEYFYSKVIRSSSPEVTGDIFFSTSYT